MLNAVSAGARYEVLNLAVPGYNARQQRLNLEERGLTFVPDLVIVAFVLNDALPPAQLVPKAARVPLSLRRILKRFLLVQLLAARAKRVPAILAGRRFKGGSEMADLAPGTPGWLTVEESLLEVKRLAGSGSAVLLLVIWPMFEALDAHYPFAAQHEQLARFCSQHGIEALDLLPSFQGSKPEALWVARDDHHPNGEAQRRAAGAIFEGLRRLGFVAPRSA